MYVKTFTLLVLCFALSTVRSNEEEDDFEGVTVEDEPDQPVNDVPYKSPLPHNKQSVYFAEHFDDPNKVNRRWIHSQAKKDGIAEEISKYDGVWKVEAPVKDGLNGDLGLVLKSRAKHAAISSRLDRPFVFNTKPLVVQYEVSLQDGQECGGAYLKLLSEGPDTKDLKQFHDKTPYTIMFGPDKCGNDHKLHFIFRHRNPLNGSFEEKHCEKPKERLEDAFKDKTPHLYTLILRPDNSFEILLDRKVINSGSLLDNFNPPVNPPEEIDDPDDKKPTDWDEREKIPDPDATKPEDWDEDAPAQILDTSAEKPDGWLDNEEPMIPDPDAKQPEDWDAEMDGEWEPPLIDNPKCATADGCGKWEQPMIHNPAYKGKWMAPLIDNPNYRGKWRPRRIPNPDYFEDKHPFKMQTISAIGFELWSMSQDILFDNIIITDELFVAEKWASETFELKKRKIAKESVSLWGRMMKAMNYKPGWWALYFVYCLTPLGIYFWYLKKRVKEESFVQRMLQYTEEYPWLWVVYVFGVGFPLVLIVYCCCKSSPREEKEEEREVYDAATIKKTDAFTKEDEPTDEAAEEDKESEEVIPNKNDLEESEASGSGQGDAPRKRKVRKD